MSEQRSDEPGRRDEDHERAAILAIVNERIRGLRLRWLTIWVVTLAFSALAWSRAGAPADDARRSAKVAEQATMRARGEADRAKAAAAEAREVAAAAQRQAQIAADQARSSCRRTRSYGPALARAYRKYRILTPQQVADYRAGIPRRC